MALRATFNANKGNNYYLSLQWLSFLDFGFVDTVHLVAHTRGRESKTKSQTLIKLDCVTEL